MKFSELHQAQEYLTSSATDEVKPNSKPDVKSSAVQDSKPARANIMKDIIVNPLTRDYENKAYSINDSFKKHVAPETLSEIEKYYSEGDRIAQKGDELAKQKEDKLLKYVDDIKNGDYHIYEKSINDFFEKEAIKKEARKKIHELNDWEIIKKSAEVAAKEGDTTELNRIRQQHPDEFRAKAAKAFVPEVSVPTIEMIERNFRDLQELRRTNVGFEKIKNLLITKDSKPKATGLLSLIGVFHGR